MITDWEGDQWFDPENYVTELGEVNGPETMKILSN